MAPTVQNPNQSKDKRRSRGVEKTSGLVTRVKYCNTLPDIPFDPKFIRYPFDASRFVEYKPTSLEKVHKTELHTDHDLGVVIDLINPETYKINPQKTYLDPADEILLEEDLPAPQDSKRSKQHSLNVSWLRRSEYISQEFNRYGVKAANIETRIGAGVKDLFNQEELYKDRDGQLAAIQKTFEEAKTEITKHYSKPNVYPVDILPVYPDMKMWQHPSAQVIFDSDPAILGKNRAEQMEEMSQAMIRGMVDEEGDQFVAYFLPTAETRRKRKRDLEEDLEYDPEETYDYKLAREYNWNVKNKASKGYEENYYFVFREDGVYYNELETSGMLPSVVLASPLGVSGHWHFVQDIGGNARLAILRVRLSKRRAKGGAGVQPTTNAVLAVKHRFLNEQEIAAQEIRRSQLEPLEPDDGEEEAENEEGLSGAEEDTGNQEEGAYAEHEESSGEEDATERKSDQEEEEEEEEQAEQSDEEEAAASSGNEDEDDEEKRNEEEIFGSASEDDVGSDDESD